MLQRLGKHVFRDIARLNHDIQQTYTVKGTADNQHASKFDLFLS